MPAFAAKEAADDEEEEEPIPVQAPLPPTNKFPLEELMERQMTFVARNEFLRFDFNERYHMIAHMTEWLQMAIAVSCVTSTSQVSIKTTFA